jgi:hypothetical protein
MFSIEHAFSITNLFALRNFPVSHSGGLNVHQRQSLGQRRIGFRVKRVQSVGSGEPNTTVPHDW